MKGVPWISSQDDALRAGWANPFVQAEDIADVLMVTLDAVHNRARKLGLKKNSLIPPRLTNIVGDIAFVSVAGGRNGAVMIDLQDLDWFLTFPGGWYIYKGHGRPYVYSRKGPRKLHRLLMSVPDDVMIDHKNRNGLDNRRGNLRLATSAQNNHNSGPRTHSRSDLKGVWSHPNGTFRVVIHNGERRVSVGYYHSEYEAARVHDAAAKILRGEWAYQNLPDYPMSYQEIQEDAGLMRLYARVRLQVDAA